MNIPPTWPPFLPVQEGNLELSISPASQSLSLLCDFVSMEEGLLHSPQLLWCSGTSVQRQDFRPARSPPSRQGLDNWVSFLRGEREIDETKHVSSQF